MPPLVLVTRAAMASHPSDRSEQNPEGSERASTSTTTIVADSLLSCNYGRSYGGVEIGRQGGPTLDDNQHLAPACGAVVEDAVSFKTSDVNVEESLAGVVLTQPGQPPPTRMELFALKIILVFDS
jgi:hypothetical protein